MHDLTNYQTNNDRILDGESANNSAAEILIGQILKSNAVLFHDQYQEAYIALSGDGSNIMKLNSIAFKQWLAHYFWSNWQKALPTKADGQVVQTLSAEACINGSLYPLEVRVADTTEALWYDLGKGKAVKITDTNWGITDKPPILFKRQSHQRIQTIPIAGEHIDILRKYTNVSSDDDWVLFVVNLVAAFIPGFPHPLLALHGSQGAGKTTLLRIMKDLVDPSVMQGQTMPTQIKEFVQMASHHAFLFFDNISSISVKMSDALARASTGDSFSKRRLYTDDDDVIYLIQRPIALNGINQVIVKPDLLDRSILIDLQRISSESRDASQDLWEAYESEKPYILGAIFDLLIQARKDYAHIQLTEMPRMADFTKWACAISEAAGYGQQDFIDAYKRNIERQNEEAIAANPVAQAVIAFMDDRESWTGTISSLKRLLDKKAFDLDLRESKYWPKEASWMGRIIQELKPTLGTVGIKVERLKTNKDRLVILTRDSQIGADAAMPPEGLSDTKTPVALSL